MSHFHQHIVLPFQVTGVVAIPAFLPASRVNDDRASPSAPSDPRPKSAHSVTKAVLKDPRPTARQTSDDVAGS